MVVCVECLPAGVAQCGVRDTPELWRGAAGLCARVRAAGAFGYVNTYIHIYCTSQFLPKAQGPSLPMHACGCGTRHLS